LEKTRVLIYKAEEEEKEEGRRRRWVWQGCGSHGGNKKFMQN
jgi:hypothetical protein